jgi:predicted transcriptional regulator
MATASSWKETAHRIIDRLPDNAGWKDLMYEAYVQQAIEDGLRDCEEGRVVDVSEVRAQFGLSP